MMKSKKSFVKCTVVALLAALCLSAVVACAKGAKKGDLFPEYNPQPNVKAEYRDQNATLDGVLNEAIWQNAAWHEMQSVRENRNEHNNVTELRDANICATVVVKENGMYLGITSDDNVIYVGETWDSGVDPEIKNTAFGKTGVSLYVTDARNRYRSGMFSYEIGFAADGMVTLGYSGNGYSYIRHAANLIYSAADCGGKLNSVDAQGYTIEAFIPWTAIPGMDVNDAPRSVVATFASHRYNNATPKDAALVWELLDQRYDQGWQQTATWVEYDENGAKTKPEGNVFGSFENFTYDIAFDISKDVAGENREITFTPDAEVRRQSRIYVHDIKDTELYAEARFTVGDLSDDHFDRYPMLGFSFHGDPATVDGETKTCVLHTGITLDLMAANKFNSTYVAPALNGENFVDRRQFNTSKPFDPTSADGFKISVYRKGELFFVFYNDTLYETKSFPYIQEDTKTFIGLYVLNMPVTVTDYVFYAGQDAAQFAPADILGYVPSDYEIDGVADEKWNSYAGGVAALKASETSGKTFTAKAVMGTNGLYFITKTEHAYYFDNGAPAYNAMANHYNGDGASGTTNVSVSLNGKHEGWKPTLCFAVSKYGVAYNANSLIKHGVIGTMRTVDSGAENSATRYTTIAEGFIPKQMIASALSDWQDGDAVPIEFAFVSHNGDERDELQNAANYLIGASNTPYPHTWPLAIPVSGELTSLAHGRYMNVGANGIETFNGYDRFVTDANGTVLNKAHTPVNFAGTLTFTHTDGTSYTAQITDGNKVANMPDMKEGVYKVTSTCKGIVFADITVSPQAAWTDRYMLKTNFRMGEIDANEKGFAVDFADGMSIKDIYGNRPTTNILLNDAINGQAWFGAKMQIPEAELRYGSEMGIVLATAAGETRIIIGDNGDNSKTAVIRYYTNAYSAESYTITDAYRNALIGDGLYVLVHRTAEGALNVYLSADGATYSENAVFTVAADSADNKVTTQTILSYGIRLNCIGLNGRKENVIGFKYAADKDAFSVSGR
ncbi:MAG: hypothetical protein HFE46_04820 [Clostridia bacterium]|nr:hypothetical protein [Clostridia bacterium]